MPNERTIRFGLLGAGLIAPFHAKALLAADGCELAGMTDLDRRRAQSVADEYGCRAYDDYDAMLADDTVDVVNVLLPNHLHLEPTLAAVRAGKHVLVEKPPAMKLGDVDEMIAAAEQARVKLGVMLNCRARQAVAAIKQALDAGRFGKLLVGDVYMKWFRPKDYYKAGDWHSRQEAGAGVTVMQAFHYTDLLTYLMGKPSSVLARMKNLAHPAANLEDNLQAFIEYENGACGTLVASTATWPGTDMRIEINGENGTAVMAGERMDTWTFRDEQPGDEDIRAIGRGGVATGASGAADFDFADHQSVIEAMAHAVRDDGEPMITASSARVTLEFTLAMYQSARTGKTITLPLEQKENIFD